MTTPTASGMVLVDVDAGCWTIALGAVVVVAVVVVGVVGVASWPGRVIVVVAVEGGTVTGGVVVVVRRATTGEVVVVRGPAGMSMSGGAVVVVVVGAMIDDAGCTHNVAGTAMTPAVAASAAKSGRRNMPTTVPDLTAARNPATPTYAVRLSLPLPSSQYRGPGTPVATERFLPSDLVRSPTTATAVRTSNPLIPVRQAALDTTSTTTLGDGLRPRPTTTVTASGVGRPLPRIGL